MYNTKCIIKPCGHFQGIQELRKKENIVVSEFPRVEGGILIRIFWQIKKGRQASLPFLRTTGYTPISFELRFVSDSLPGHICPYNCLCNHFCILPGHKCLYSCLCNLSYHRYPGIWSGHRRLSLQHVRDRLPATACCNTLF